MSIEEFRDCDFTGMCNFPLSTRDLEIDTWHARGTLAFAKVLHCTSQPASGNPQITRKNIQRAEIF
jgi:hypothetical protein